MDWIHFENDSGVWESQNVIFRYYHVQKRTWKVVYVHTVYWRSSVMENWIHHHNGYVGLLVHQHNDYVSLRWFIYAMAT